MKNIFAFMRRERLYILILIFVMIFNAMMLLHNEPGQKAKVTAAASALSSNRGQMEELLKTDPRLSALFGLATILILAILLLGFVVDLILSPLLIKGTLNIRTCDPPEAGWGIWDVCKVAILFLFFGYIVIIAEAFLSTVFYIFRQDNFRMIINTSILDTLAVVFIIYFAIDQRKAGLRALGINLKNFSRNVFYGITGYISLVPVLILILIITAVVINVTKYTPERQPVVELFLKEKGGAFLAYTSLFAAIIGPIVEELFFRGFMYGALKKYIGIFWSMIATAALFAALHTHIVGFFPIFALGILLAYLYEKTGTLVSSITVHVIHNLSMVFLVFLVKQVGII